MARLEVSERFGAEFKIYRLELGTELGTWNLKLDRLVSRILDLETILNTHTHTHTHTHALSSFSLSLFSLVWNLGTAGNSAGLTGGGKSGFYAR